MDPATTARVEAWTLHEQARELVRRAARALGSDVRSMPLKGVLLAATGIVHPAERPIRDVDLLVDGRSERTLVARLVRAGFRVAEVARAPGYVALAHEAHGDLWLDLHTRVVPIGLGHLPPARIFEGATRDDATFGARVFLPTRSRLAVQLTANVLKDRVVHARRHAATDLAAVLAGCSAGDLDAIATGLRAASLRRGGSLVMMWVHRTTGSAAARGVLDRLTVDPRETRALARALDAAGSRGAYTPLARLRARARADAPALRLLAVVAAGAAHLSYPVRAKRLVKAGR